MTVKQVAARGRVGRSTVYQMCVDGKIPHRRIGSGRGTIRIDPADADAAAPVVAGRAAAPERA